MTETTKTLFDRLVHLLTPIEIHTLGEALAQYTENQADRDEWELDQPEVQTEMARAECAQALLDIIDAKMCSWAEGPSK